MTASKTVHPPPGVRVFDIRAGEGRTAGFALLLLFIIGAHTVLETARDTLLLTGPGPRALGLAYILIAVATLPSSAVVARLGVRYGPRRTLVLTLLAAVAGAAVMFVVPSSRPSAIATYVLSGVLGSVLVPQFWTLVGSSLTAAQGRRLFGLIAAGGVVGGVLGPAMSAALLEFFPVTSLLVLSAAVFGLAATVVARMKLTERTTSLGAPRVSISSSLRAFREQPFLRRVALVVFVSTATFLVIDYLFKSTLARALPRAEVGPFVARYYLGLNVVSFLVQILLSSMVVQRLGVVAAVILTPLLLTGSATAALLAGGTLAAVLVLKAVDGSLRYSIHRITEELIYLPVPIIARQRAKPLVDGALARAAQTLTGVGLLALGGTELLTPRLLAAMVAALAAVWLGAALTMRRPYLSLLRSSIASGSIDAHSSPEPIDLESAGLLVQHLASEDPLEVIAAMNALARRGRGNLVPALVLYHHDEGVLAQALEVFGDSSRSDWFPLARRLLHDSREGVRVAAARALTRHEQIDARQLAQDVGPRARGYAAVHLVLRSSEQEVLADPRVAEMMRSSTEDGQAARLGILAAIVDAQPTPRLSSLLLACCGTPSTSADHAELVALAAKRQRDAGVIPHLVVRLSEREGREALRAALVALGEPAFEAVSRVLTDKALPRRLRLHAPKTLARFGTKRAAESLLENIETETDGSVRFKSIRALDRLVVERHVFLDRARIERICQAELARHFEALVMRGALGAAAPSSGKDTSMAERLLGGLLDDKARHSLERAFRLLQIAHPRERIHPVYLACRFGDAYAKANAAEFLDTLLRRRDQVPMRALFAAITDDLTPEDRVERGRSILRFTEARTQEEAIEALLHDADVTVASLAGLCAVESGSGALRTAFDEVRRLRPEIASGQGHPFSASDRRADDGAVHA